MKSILRDQLIAEYTQRLEMAQAVAAERGIALTEGELTKIMRSVESEIQTTPSGVELLERYAKLYEQAIIAAQEKRNWERAQKLANFQRRRRELLRPKD